MSRSEYDMLIAKRDLYTEKRNNAKSTKGKLQWYSKLMEVEDKLMSYGGRPPVE